MTKKVKIPQEVADAIETFRNADFSNFGIASAINDREFPVRLGLVPERLTLRSWSHGDDGGNADKLLDALVNGWDIEHSYSTGDWVQDNQGNIGVVSRVEGTKIWGEWNGNKHQAYALSREIVKKFTPEEIRAEKERQKWEEIEEGDVLIGKKSATLAVLVMEFPEHSEVKVRVHNHHFQTWDKDSVELYAKKVGATND